MFFFGGWPSFLLELDFLYIFLFSMSGGFVSVESAGSGRRLLVSDGTRGEKSQA